MLLFCPNPDEDNDLYLPFIPLETLIGNSSIAETLIDSDINAVTFTGSVPVGAKVAQRATSHLKKTVLELGGERSLRLMVGPDVTKQINQLYYVIRQLEIVVVNHQHRDR